TAVDKASWALVVSCRSIVGLPLPRAVSSGLTAAGPTSAGPTSAGPTSAGPTSAGPVSPEPVSPDATHSKLSLFHSTLSGPRAASDPPLRPVGHVRNTTLG